MTATDTQPITNVMIRPKGLDGIEIHTVDVHVSVGHFPPIAEGTEITRCTVAAHNQVEAQLIAAQMAQSHPDRVAVRTTWISCVI